jgi:hypothetical protein
MVCEGDEAESGGKCMPSKSKGSKTRSSESAPQAPKCAIRNP